MDDGVFLFLWSLWGKAYNALLLVLAVSSPVAGQTSDFVNQILENTGQGDPTGGLVGLRVPTSKC